MSPVRPLITDSGLFGLKPGAVTRNTNPADCFCGTRALASSLDAFFVALVGLGARSRPRSMFMDTTRRFGYARLQAFRRIYG